MLGFSLIQTVRYDATFVKLITNISPQNQVVDEVNDPRHGGFRSSFVIVWLREIDGLSPIQKSSREQDVVDICRRRLQVLRLHDVGCDVAAFR